MARAPDWSEQEFETLLRNPQLSDEEVARLLPRRTLGAIGAVRSFLHNFHEGGDISGLSQMMASRLRRGSWTCSKCDYRC